MKKEPQKKSMKDRGIILEEMGLICVKINELLQDWIHAYDFSRESQMNFIKRELMSKLIDLYIRAEKLELEIDMDWLWLIQKIMMLPKESSYQGFKEEAIHSAWSAIQYAEEIETKLFTERGDGKVRCIACGKKFTPKMESLLCDSCFEQAKERMRKTESGKCPICSGSVAFNEFHQNKVNAGVYACSAKCRRILKLVQHRLSMEKAVKK